MTCDACKSLANVRTIQHMSNPSTALTLDNEVDLNVARIVKILLALNGWEQREFAARMQMDPSTVTRLLKGQRAWKLADLRRLGLLFDKPMGYFLEQPEDVVRSRCFSRDDLADLADAA